MANLAAITETKIHCNEANIMHLTKGLRLSRHIACIAQEGKLDSSSYPIIY